MPLARWQATITDDAGNVVPAASVEVRDEATGLLALLKPNRDGSGALGNPFNADAQGFAAFYVVGGAYKIIATSGAFSREWRYVAIGTAAEFDSSVFGAAADTDDAVTAADAFLHANSGGL